ncbi:MAG TPA: T9SS type A sorting domain-containing protein [Chitinophagales bacterium]|nr:T9SS type A sorting domain-containing protein [Chitinophagales bacterium]
MKQNITLIATVLVISIFFALPLTSLAQDGSLDPTFGTNGVVTTPIGFTDESAHSIAIQPNGKIVVAGSSENGPQDDFALVRYNTDGSLDNTFSTDGKVTTPIGTYEDYGNSVAIQSDGKIVVAGSSYNSNYYLDFAVVRYNTNGVLDTSFDTDGIVITNIGTHDDRANSMAIQNDGKIVVAGYSYNGADGYFAVVRYNTNGSLDSTFDTDGKVTTAFGSIINWGYAVAIQNDGKIVVVGLAGNFFNSHFALVRYNTDGSLDSSFDADGKVTTAVGVNYDGGYAIAIQSDGKIVAAGYSSSPDGSDDDFALVRYNNDGSLDTTLDNDGKVSTPFGPFADTGNSVAIQSDGKIVVAGYSVVGGTNYYFALVRYNDNGSLDATFDADGKVTTLFGPDSDTGYGVAIQSDGKIVMVGDSWNGSSTDFAIVRYNNSIATGINESGNQTREISIYPNPVSPDQSGSTTISISLSESQKVSLRIFDMNGRLITTLANAPFEQGNHEIVWNAADVNAGIYFLQLLTEENSETVKLVVAK